MSVVFPSVTATEFHDSLRQGSMPRGGMALGPQPPEEVAEAVLRAVETGEEEIVLSHRPRDPGPDSR